MLSPLSGISSAVSIASARFDRAASAVVDATGASDDSATSDALAPAIVAMLTERLALRAAIEVARTTYDTIDTVINDL